MIEHFVSGVLLFVPFDANIAPSLSWLPFMFKKRISNKITRCAVRKVIFQLESLKKQPKNTVKSTFLGFKF